MQCPFSCNCKIALKALVWFRLSNAILVKTLCKPLAEKFLPLQYMDRIYVKHHNKLYVDQLGLLLWKDHVMHWEPIRDRALSILLDMVQKERNGEIIDRALVRSITQVRELYSSYFACLPAISQV